MKEADNRTNNVEETIAAVATAYGEGGIGIIRLSGEKSLEILQKIFVSKKKMAPLPQFENRKLTYGDIVNPMTGETIDEVLAVYMKGPATYTCEDVVEIHCHGSVVSLRKVLGLTYELGARVAEPGEFTKRAFLNGRLDLAQAEAVADLVKAGTGQALNIAVDQLEGSLSWEVQAIRAMAMEVLVNMAVNIDYPDEDIEVIVYKDMEKNLEEILKRIQALLDSADTGRIIREGLTVAIAGKPNVGKSSLLNALLGEARAIVTDIPGTTRDTIDEFISIRDIPVHLVDTAGIRKTEDIIEKKGIEKSRETIKAADLVFIIIDASSSLEKEDKDLLERLANRPAILLLNKTDLANKVKKEEIRKHFPKGEIIETALVKGQGISQVEDEVEKLVYEGKASQKNSLMVTNTRHEQLLKDAKGALNDAIRMTQAEEALELIEIDVRNCYEALGDILGESLNNDIIDEVFARFCLGK